MKYLSFDLECCDGQHVCEFGYVIIDEEFNILEGDLLTINPEQKFNLTGWEIECGGKLAFTEDVYYGSPAFDFYYDTIKKILTTPDCQIIGFSLANDVNFLNTAYERYEKEPVKFDYIDFQKLYQGYTKAKSVTSVGGFVEDLQIKDIRLHRSYDDALAVIRALEIISKRENLSLPKTIELLQKREKEGVKERELERRQEVIKRAKEGYSNAQREVLKVFVRKLTPSNDNRTNPFYGKRVCISSHLQKNKFNEYLSLIQRLYACGATYTGGVEDCNLFIQYQVGQDKEPRQQMVDRVYRSKKKRIVVMTFEDALEKLKVKEEDLSSVDNVTIKVYDSSGAKNKEQKPHPKKTYTEETKKGASIADILKAKGVKFN